MKVGFITTVFMQFGGTETWHRSLLPYINNLTHFCVFGQFKGDPSFLPEHVNVLRGQKGALAVLKECDVVVTWGITNLDSLCEQAGRRPTLISVHHGDPTSSWARKCTDNIRGYVNQIVAVHPEVARIYDGVWIPNGIDIERIRPTEHASHLRELWKIGDRKVCFWAARYAPEKNPYLAQRIGERLPQDWVLVMAGDPPESFKKTTSDRVIHVGSVTHPGDWLSISSCFLSTSDQEGFGLSIGEAMLARVPIVGTPVGLCQYPGVCRTFLIRTGRQPVVDAITTPPPGKQLEAAYDLVSKFSITKQAESWNNLIKETHALAIIE